MKIDSLKKRLVKEAIIAGGITLVFAVIFYIAYSYYGGLEDENQQFTRKRSTIVNKLRSIETEYANTSESFAVYSKLSNNKLPEPVHKEETTYRISVARPIVERLTQRFDLSDLDVSFSRAFQNEDFKDMKTPLVYTNQISLSFKAPSDEKTIQFIAELDRSLPGYIEIEKFRMQRERLVTEDLLSGIKGKSRKAGLVDVDLEIIWHTLKEPPKEEKK